MKNKSHFRQEFYYFSIKAENNLKMMLVAKFGNEEQLCLTMVEIKVNYCFLKVKMLIWIFYHIFEQNKC